MDNFAETTIGCTFDYVFTGIPLAATDFNISCIFVERFIQVNKWNIWG